MYKVTKIVRIRAHKKRDFFLIPFPASRKPFSNGLQYGCKLGCLQAKNAPKIGQCSLCPFLSATGGWLWSALKRGSKGVSAVFRGCRLPAVPIF